MTVLPGQIYAACHPMDEGRRIRIESHIPGHATATVVDADTGKRPRSIRVTVLHPTPTTRTGRARRSGYALENTP
ncbi:hypothetical protein AB0K51_09250 [Kitasatospora sp. NPDC049285]|uniref:hypothetical protein n=1 Tax=Kitasatospora sp. NPDC049285 TaxID=3157096 RepID=UPI00344A0661